MLEGVAKGFQGKLPFKWMHEAKKWRLQHDYILEEGEMPILRVSCRCSDRSQNHIPEMELPGELQATSKRVTPTKARLCKKANDWKWSSANFN